MDILKIRDELLEVNEQLDKLQERQKALTEKLQENCKHEALIESESFVILNVIPPRRMCLVCGLERDGWACGYGQLSNDKSIMKKFAGQRGRDEFYKYRKLQPLEELAEIITAKSMQNLLAHT